MRFRSIRKIFLTVDGYDVDERLESFGCLLYSTTRYRESQVLLAVYSHRFDIYLGAGGGGGVDLRAHLSIDHRRVSFCFACLIFAVGLNGKITLTAKFS